MSETKERTPLALELGAAGARARVAEDVKELAEQLQPQHPLTALARRAMGSGTALSRGTAGYARRHPFASLVAVGVAATVFWRLALRRC